MSARLTEVRSGPYGKQTETDVPARLYDGLLFFCRVALVNNDVAQGVDVRMEGLVETSRDEVLLPLQRKFTRSTEPRSRLNVFFSG